MTLNNLKEALILNNIKLLEKIKTLIVTQTHSHDNKDVIDKFSQTNDGTLLFNNEEIKGGSSGQGSVDITGSLDYVNESLGIEDTPIGHVMTYIGTTAPKHYLACDGSEYNISDYPYLANHILKEFGSYDYYGGDGITTFAVPKLEGTETLFSPQLDESSSHLATSSDYYNSNYTAFKAFNCNLEDDNCWISGNSTVSPSSPSWIQIDLGELSKINGILIYPRLTSNQNEAYNPKSFKVLASKDGQDWDTLGEYTNVTDWSGEIGNFFEFNKTGYYSIYRVVVTESCTSSYVAIGDIHFLSEQTDFQCIKSEPTYYVVVKMQQVEDDVISELRQEIEQLKEFLNKSSISNVLNPMITPSVYAKPKEISAQVNSTPITSSALILPIYSEPKEISVEIRNSHVISPIIATIDVKEV